MLFFVVSAAYIRVRHLCLAREEIVAPAFTAWFEASVRVRGPVNAVLFVVVAWFK